MKPEDILKLVREGSTDIIEGLGALESLGKNLTIMGQVLGASSKDLRKVIEVAEKVSKKIHPQKP